MNASRIAVAAFALALAAGPAAADGVADFYKGKTVSIYVGSAVGGGFNAFARTVGKHMMTHVPGRPDVIYLNMPGAGGRKATGYVANVAPKDGTAIGATQPGAIVEPVLGDSKRSKYDPRTFGFIGSPEKSDWLCIARKDAAVQKFEDVFTHQLLIGGSGKGSTTHDIGLAIKNVLGARFKMVNGYKGSHAMTLAIERGELQGMCGYGWSPLMSQAGFLVREHKINILVQFSLEGYPEPNRLGVPLIWKFVKTPEQKRILELIAYEGIFSRPEFFPGGVPKERLAAFRGAFDQTMKDPAFLADAARLKLELSPSSGAQMEAAVNHIFNAPPEILAKTRAALYTE